MAELDIDWIALSFVNEASDVTQAREVLTQIGSPINLIAKIERLEALKQLFWIIKASDGVMVARGDLALESGPGELTGLQKDIIKQTVKGKKDRDNSYSDDGVNDHKSNPYKSRNDRCF